jgi:hypothetical protein
MCGGMCVCMYICMHEIYIYIYIYIYTHTHTICIPVYVRIGMGGKNPHLSGAHVQVVKYLRGTIHLQVVKTTQMARHESRTVSSQPRCSWQMMATLLAQTLARHVLQISTSIPTQRWCSARFSTRTSRDLFLPHSCLLKMTVCWHHTNSQSTPLRVCRYIPRHLPRPFKNMHLQQLRRTRHSLLPLQYICLLKPSEPFLSILL